MRGQVNHRAIATRAGDGIAGQLLDWATHFESVNIDLGDTRGGNSIASLRLYHSTASNDLDALGAGSI